jgi:XTP/dITP diphosphohydrolase
VAGRLLVVVVSPRVPPGQLSWPAWQALRSAPVVTAAESPQLPFLREAGVDVTVVDGLSVEQLHDRAAGGGTVVWLTTGDADAELVRAAGIRAVTSGVRVEQVHGSYDGPGFRLLDVVAVMDRLRSPGGCPWDAAQTHASLLPYLLEEAYEACQAIEDGNLADLREEMGDVLLQVAFHARLAEEGDAPWSIDDVAGDLVDKLVRRHPHVFAGGSADDLEGSWESLKAAEKGRTSVTDGVPLAQPALSLAAKLQRRAVRLGAPVPPAGGLGGELWGLVARCRDEGLDPEAELRRVARAFRDRLAAVEAAVLADGREPSSLTGAEWEDRWT